MQTLLASTHRDPCWIAEVRHREATRLAQTELECFVAVVETLDDEGRNRPTACPLWNVRQLVAQSPDAAAAYTSWLLFRRQGDPSVRRPYRVSGLSQLDAMNQI